jgi:hypothetical protein
LNHRKEFCMQSCNRRGFLTHIMAGTAALAIVGRACAGETVAGENRSCADCAFFNAKPGSDDQGTCGDRGDQPVAADGGCGNFKARPETQAAATNHG